MKKFILLVFILLSFTFGQACSATEPTNISFIYINGSNDLSYKNRLKFKETFENDVKKMHPIMMQGFEEDELGKKMLLQNGKYKINPEPIIFYWGDRSLNEIKNIDSGLNSAQHYTPKIAQKIRSIFAHCLHDAIWVQKYPNMGPLIDDLQKLVKTETDKGNKVVLLGYSAGSFISYQYFLNKFTSINPKELYGTKNNTELQEIIANNPVKPTCLDALIESDLVRLDASEKFHTNNNVETFKNNYPNLDEKTEKVCFKDTSIKGVINFASPLILFYSDITDANTDINFLSQLMLKNIIEKDIFFLTVNYRNDPLGFPNNENLTIDKLKNSNSIIAKYLKPGKGFVYNKSDIYVPRTFISAHMAYWKTPKRFVKGVIKAYNDGFSTFYGLNCSENCE